MGLVKLKVGKTTPSAPQTTTNIQKIVRTVITRSVGTASRDRLNTYSKRMVTET